MTEIDGRRERAMETYKKMGWGNNGHLKEVDEDFWAITTDLLFGEIWSRPGLSLRERELVTLGTLMAAKADGIATHMRNAHALGITFAEIKEVIIQCTFYLGMPKGIWAIRKLKEVMDADAKPGSTQK
jgi:4-carboxymuconolactone decarboxylase